MKVNMNDNVRVKLTDRGRQILRQNWAKYGVQYEIREDEDGYYQTQLWCLFQDFGKSIRIGGNLPFSTEIEFVK